MSAIFLGLTETPLRSAHAAPSIRFPIDWISYGLAFPQIDFPIDSLSYRFAAARLKTISPLIL